MISYSKREQNPKLRFICDINDEEYDSHLSDLENEQVKFPIVTTLSSLKRWAIMRLIGLFTFSKLFSREGIKSLYCFVCFSAISYLLDYNFYRDLKRLIEECAEEKTTAITMCENIAEIEG